jgi:hypothetical protein
LSSLILFYSTDSKNKLTKIYLNLKAANFFSAKEEASGSSSSLNDGDAGVVGGDAAVDDDGGDEADRDIRFDALL